MDAGKMAMLASKWKEVPEQIKCEIEGSDKAMWVSIFSFLFKFFFDVPFRKQKLTFLRVQTLLASYVIEPYL